MLGLVYSLSNLHVPLPVTEIHENGSDVLLKGSNGFCSYPGLELYSVGGSNCVGGVIVWSWEFEGCVSVCVSLDSDSLCECFCHTRCG